MMDMPREARVRTWEAIQALDEQALNFALERCCYGNTWEQLREDLWECHHPGKRVRSAPHPPQPLASWDSVMDLATTAQVERYLVRDGADTPLQWLYLCGPWQEEGTMPEPRLSVPLDAPPQAHRLALARLVLWRHGQQGEA